MARTALNISNAQLAELADVAPNTVSRFERGLDVRMSSVRAMREALEARGAVFITRGTVAPVDGVGLASDPD